MNEEKAINNEVFWRVTVYQDITFHVISTEHVSLKKVEGKDN